MVVNNAASYKACLTLDMFTDDPESWTLVMDSVYPLKKLGKVGIEGSALDRANDSCKEIK